jgi:hypothetical protein
VGEVLARERGDHEFGDLDELDLLARHVHRLPPPDLRVKRASEVVLINLAPIQQPAVVLVLAKMRAVLILSPRHG